MVLSEIAKYVIIKVLLVLAIEGSWRWGPYGLWTLTYGDKTLVFFEN